MVLTLFAVMREQILATPEHDPVHVEEVDGWLYVHEGKRRVLSHLYYRSGLPIKAKVYRGEVPRVGQI